MKKSGVPQNPPYTCVSSAVSSGGRQICKTTLEATLEDVGEKLILEGLKQNPKEIAFELTKEAAKKGAEEEFKKHSFKFVAKDFGVAGLKGVIRSVDLG